MSIVAEGIFVVASVGFSVVVACIAIVALQTFLRAAQGPHEKLNAASDSAKL